MPHSTYSKIYDLLSVVKDSGPRDIFELSQHIHDSKLESFAIWRRTQGSDRSIKHYCSPSSVRRVIRFTHKLGLIELENQRTCRIQPAGENALMGENYPVQLGTQLMKYMRDEIGLSFEDLKKVISSIKPPQVADSSTIFLAVSKRSGVDVSEESLRRLLFLLQRCGKLNAAIKKVYST